MTFEVINVATTNTQAAFETADEAYAAYEEIVKSEPRGEFALVAFDANGDALELLAAPAVHEHA